MATSAFAAPSQSRSGTSVNVGDLERLLCAVGGTGLAIGGLLSKSPVAKIALPILGGMLVYRGTSGHCSLYAALGVNTACQTGEATAVRAGHGFKVEQSVTVNRPPQEVYSFWRRLDRLPQFMENLREVRVLDQTRSHWVAKGPAGMPVEWDAEIINDRPGELIAWRSLEGSTVDTAGSVHFRPAAGGRGTEVTVSLKYDPPGGKSGSWLAGVAGASPEKQIRDDLQRLQRLLEGGGQDQSRQPQPAHQGAAHGTGL